MFVLCVYGSWMFVVAIVEIVATALNQKISRIEVCPHFCNGLSLSTLEVSKLHVTSECSLVLESLVDFSDAKMGE